MAPGNVNLWGDAKEEAVVLRFPARILESVHAIALRQKSEWQSRTPSFLKS
jgi:hypothetical protein